LSFGLAIKSPSFHSFGNSPYGRAPASTPPDASWIGHCPFFHNSMIEGKIAGKA
jgi:hypothetical protein